MNPGTLACTRCHVALPSTQEELASLRKSPACGANLDVHAFAALLRDAPKGRTGELVLEDGEAGCFYHPNKRANVACAVCGRFLCGLCNLELNGQHYCPQCLQKGGARGTIQNLERKRTRYDNIAVSLVVLPLLLGCFMVITAPAALFVIVRYWKSPPSLVERSRAKMAIAGVLAILELGAGIAIWAAIFR